MKFSIILPVRNGGEYVKECVKSILSQTFTEFSFIVLDNCSADGTVEWIESLNDSRIIIYRSDRSLSIEENWARIISVPKNEFITLIGHDDVLDACYLEEMHKLISEYPDASLYQTHFRFIDSNGLVIGKSKGMLPVQDKGAFLADILSFNIDVMGTGFMVRSKDYDAIGGMPLYPDLMYADIVLWLQLTGISYKATSSKECFSYRTHQSLSRTSIKSIDALHLFVLYLNELKNTTPTFNNIISSNSTAFIEKYCQAFAHRLLRIPYQDRNYLNVKTFVEQCKKDIELLTGKEYFPYKRNGILLAKIIDSNFLFRNIFYRVRKLYNKPFIAK